jgi:hypothetical protein
VRTPAPEREVDLLFGGGRLVDEALLHLEADEQLERIDVGGRADAHEELADRLAVLPVARQDGLVAPGVLFEEGVDLVGGNRGGVAELFVREEVVLVERFRDVRGAIADVVGAPSGARGQHCAHGDAKHSERASSYHVVPTCTMCAMWECGKSGSIMDQNRR